MQRTVKLHISMALLIGAALTALLLSFNFTADVEAQGFADPTATPSDFSWLGFSAARSAIEEEKSVNLTMVRNWAFAQTEFVNGFEYGCDSDVPVNDVSKYYFGWTYTITDLFGVVYQARVTQNADGEYIAVVCDEVVQTETAPAEGEGGQPATDVDLPAPVAGSAAMGGFELGGHVLGLGPDTQNAMRRAGMTWVKKQLRYNLGDSGGNAQGMIDQARAANFKILLGIVGYPDQMGDYESYIQSYAQYVGEVAALGPDAIEVWNEPNLAREWPAGQIDGARYTQLLAAAYNAIKSVNPNILVISGAPAPTGAENAFPGEVVNDDRFMQQMADAGAGSYMDCIGLHYNEGIVSPSQNSGDPRGEFPTRYFGSMLARGYSPFGGSKPVCWTELGYLSPEGMGSPLPPLFAWAEDVSVAEQAAWLADAAARSAQTGYVRLLIIWNVNFELWGADPMGGYAMIRPDGTCPACDTLGQVMGG